ncbi:hypothetical protein RRG08_045100 [Elysia crispata]|uniref:Uncharacterized protein n=1 Tax=Elysia crispata TaxID=231223 RepID=A0AAE0YT35_9GAST|nr:hypothetical protein RRG08_045100 [Elysia crispata]
MSSDVLRVHLELLREKKLRTVCPAILCHPVTAYLSIIDVLLPASSVQFDLGYECGSHTNRLLPHHSMASGKRFALRISLVVLFGLFLSIIFNNQSSGDVWEINRTQFELRTTRVILKLAAIVTAFILPETLTPIYMFNGLTYKETRIMHITMQLSAHKGLCLILVLLSRKEFRRHLVLVFESRESIRRTRTTNLLISHAPARGFSSSRQLRFSDARSSREMMGSADSQNGMEQPAIVVPAAMPSLASQSVEKSGLVSRDKITGVQTPDWLRKKETPAAWSLSRFFKKHQSPTISTCGSDV